MITPNLQGLAVPIESLALDPENARTHNDRNLEAIKRSLQAFGQLKPIVVRDGVARITRDTGTAAWEMAEVHW